MNNTRLVEDIFEIARSLTPGESDAFERTLSVKGKRKHTDDDTAKCLRLYQLYRSHSDEPEVSRSQIKREANFTKSIDDLNQHLCKKLELFLGDFYRKNSGLEIAKLDQELDTVSELINRKRFRHAGEMLVKISKALAAIPKTDFTRKHLYVSLRFYELQFNWHITNTLTEKKQERLKDFSNVIQPFNTLAEYIRKVNGYEHFSDLDAEEINDSPFYGMLISWLRERNKLDSLARTLRDDDFFGGLMLSHRSGENVSNAKNRNGIAEKMINGLNIIVRLEKVYLSALVGDQFTFDEQVERILNDGKLFHHPQSFNPELTAFVFSQLFRLTVLSENTEHTQLMSRLIHLRDLSQAELHQFTKEQVTDIQYRFALNEIVILFLQENYEVLVKTLSAAGFESKSKKYEEYFYEVIAVELLARLQSGMLDDETEKLRRKYEQNLKPSIGGASTFHGALRKIISGFSKSSDTTARKDIVQDYWDELRTAVNPTNHFHKVILMWLDRIYRF